jgi:hypothetical protein
MLVAFRNNIQAIELKGSGILWIRELLAELSYNRLPAKAIFLKRCEAYQMAWWTA